METYKVLECIVCGWIYDEEKGAPEEGLAPGTRWEDIPDDWECPECGVGKDQFEMIEQRVVADQNTAVATPSAVKPSFTEESVSYSVWECVICGWLYDEQKGAPEEGIAPGTRWEDVPDDWTCPDCGVGKDEFEMIRVVAPVTELDAPGSAPEQSILSNKVVIVGGGLAGYHMARKLRAIDKQVPITLITEDSGDYYSKPALSTAFAKELYRGDLVSATAQQQEGSLNIEVMPLTKVLKIDRVNCSLMTSAGEVSYDKLILALGSESIQIPVNSAPDIELYSINSLDDFDGFNRRVSPEDRILIIGGGLIGSEYANDLSVSHHKVHVVDIQPHLLASLIPTPISIALEEQLKKAGADIHTDTTVKSIHRGNGALQVCLENGTTFEVDHVLMAVGVKPRIELAASAGLEVNRGVVVDGCLRTSDANIFAVGDCAEVNSETRFYLAAMNHCIEVLASCLAGGTAEVEYPILPVAIKTTQLPIITAPPANNVDGTWQVEQAPQNIIARYIAPNGDLKGFALAGEAVSELGRLLKDCVK